jgi:glycosyltransferase involved in cell wall biosynthesis
MRKYCRPQVTRRLQEFLAHKKHDVVVCDFLLTAGAMAWDTGVPVVIFAHNVETTIWRRHVEANRSLLWKLAAQRESRTISNAERHFTGLADHVLTVSDSDRTSFLEYLPEQKVTTIPTGVDLDFFRPGPPAEDATLVFTGSMDWMPNEDAVVHFSQDILPRIQRELPKVRFSVVGRNPSKKLLSLALVNPAIQVTGAVEDIRPYVHAASVFIVPLRIGSGTRIKIFEAMAMAKPVVSTSIGAEGLPVAHERELFIADSPTEFANRTVQLLKDSKIRQQMGNSARRLVESRYGWQQVADKFEQALLDITKKRGIH